MEIYDMHLRSNLNITVHRAIRCQTYNTIHAARVHVRERPEWAVIIKEVALIVAIR